MYVCRFITRNPYSLSSHESHVVQYFDTSIDITNPSLHAVSMYMTLLCCLVVPRTTTVLGTCNFVVAGPLVWNSLPANIRSASVSLRPFLCRLLPEDKEHICLNCRKHN